MGSGKTALVLKITEALRDKVPLGVVTNDIFTQVRYFGSESQSEQRSIFWVVVVA